MRLPRLLLALLLAPLLAVSLPRSAEAAVTVTFWSHELGNEFPHAFLTFHGVPDAGGPPVDLSYGFTARTISPAILFGKVSSRMDVTKPNYIRRSDAQFAMTMTDAQYTALRGLVDAWSDNKVRYDLDTANCIHFTKEAARLLGLQGLDQPKLMRRPRSYLQAVAAANPGRVTIVRRHGRDYLPTLPPLAPSPEGPPIPAPVIVPPPVPVPVPVPAGTSSTTSSTDPNRG